MRSASPRTVRGLVGWIVGATAATLFACGGSSPRATSHGPSPELRAVLSLGASSVEYRIDCVTDYDCASAAVVIDCCGTTRELGLRSAERDALLTNVERVLPHAGTCECLAEPTRRDDESIVGEGESTFVACVARRCATGAAPPSATSGVDTR